MAYSCSPLPRSLQGHIGNCRAKDNMRDRTGVEGEVKGNRAILRLEAAGSHPVAGQGPTARGTLLGKQAAQEGPVLALPSQLHRPQLIVPRCFLQQCQRQLCPAPAEVRGLPSRLTRLCKAIQVERGRCGCQTPGSLPFSLSSALLSGLVTSFQHLLIWPIPGRGGLRATVPEALMEGL